MNVSNKVEHRHDSVSKNMRYAASGLLLGFCMLAYHPPPALHQSPNDDNESVRKFLDGLMAADNAGDVERIISHYADDAISLPPNDGAVIGKEAIAARYKAGFAKFKMEVTLSSDETQVCGDWAFNRGITKGRLVWHDGSDSTLLNDKYLMILRKQADNSWKITRLMWSSNAKN